jgi:hypothetical protein
MTSKLFHTVVGFGIALGAATMGCSAESADGSVSANSAETTTSNDTTQPAPKADPFCEVGWPTTKGGPRPARQQACIDPQNQCGAYPGLTGLHTSREVCVKAADVHSCGTDEQDDAFMFCKDNADGTHGWACPSGTIPVDQCVWGSGDTGTTNAMLTEGH